MESLKVLLLGATSIARLPNSIGDLGQLQCLNLVCCYNLVTLPSSICNLMSLESISLLNCKNFERLPDEIGRLDKLRFLYLDNCYNLQRLPSSIYRLELHDPLVLDSCVVLEEFYKKLVAQLMGFELSKLSLLNLDDINMNDDDILYFCCLPTLNELSSLERLVLSRNMFSTLPPGLGQLTNLKQLELGGCIKLRTILELPPNLRSLVANDCTSLEKLPDLSHLAHLELLILKNCIRLVELPGFESLQNLKGVNTINCIGLGELNNMSNIPQWHQVKQRKSLVGLESRIQEIKLLMGPGFNDVRRMQICGMHGIGKTTIVQEVFRQISWEFDKSCFLKVRRENTSSSDPLQSLQHQLLQEILKENDVSLRDWDASVCKIQRRLGHKKVLLVLDDVDHVEQLEFLAEFDEWFGLGSRIIVTSKDESLLHEFITYRVELLDGLQATKLFCRHAFDSDNPPVVYEEVTRVVVKYTNHLPLALQLLGSHLRGQELVFWESVEKVLAKITNSMIHGLIKLIFDGLSIIQRNIFLDIACFFNGVGRDRVVKILDWCGFESTSEIQALIDKSLITIDSTELVQMHYLIQDMGRYIACEDYANSRFWLKEQIPETMRTTERLEAVKAIISPSDCTDGFSGEVLRNMKKLRLLHVSNNFTSSEPTHLPDELRWLRWDEYPFYSFSLSIATSGSKLASLDLKASHIERISFGKMILNNLKFISLTFSSELTRFPDISSAPNLEGLDLACCNSLVEVDESVGSLKRLVCLYVFLCKQLRLLPSRLDMDSLETFILFGCDSLKRFPEISSNMWKLSYLDLLHCPQLKELPSSFWFLTGLTKLCLGSCNLPPSLPNTICELDLTRNNFTSLPASICDLSCLKLLKLNGCDNLEELTELPSRIQVLEVRHCCSLKKIGDVSNKCRWLYKITFFGCLKLPQSDEETQNHLVNLLRKSLVQKFAAVNQQMSVTIPGLEIPEWLSNQQSGNKIALKLPSSSHTTIKGFAFSFTMVCNGFFVVNPKIALAFKLQHHEDLDDLNQSAFGSLDNTLGNPQLWMGYIPFDTIQKMYRDNMPPHDWSVFEGYLVVTLSSHDEHDYQALAFGGCIIHNDEVEKIEPCPSHYSYLCPLECIIDVTNSELEKEIVLEI